jgi:glycosyltransferase involved in cell wall biosynthesis
VGGAEQMMVNILNYFSLDNMEVHLIVFNFSGELKASLNSELIVHDLGIASVMNGMPKCLKELHRIKADIIFTGIGHLNIALVPFVPFMRFLLPKSKWIARETNIVSLQNQTSKYPKLFDWLYKHMYKNYDNIIAQSKDMKEDLEKHYFRSEKIVLINNPIDSKRLNRLSIEETRFKFNVNKVNLLSVSRLREQKRHDLMLETLTFLPMQYHLTIVGSGEKEENLKKLCKKLDLESRVTFEGQQSNPYTYMKNADLFLLSSEREGFPNVLLEANALGLPIVAFSCKGGIKEIISEGINGFYVPFLECEHMAKKIEEASSFNFNKDEIITNTLRKYGQYNILKKYKEIFLK